MSFCTNRKMNYTSKRYRFGFPHLYLLEFYYFFYLVAFCYNFENVRYKNKSIISSELCKYESFHIIYKILQFSLSENIIH